MIKNTSLPPPNFRKAMWIMYDMSVNSLPRRQAFTQLRALGLTPRAAAELIHEQEHGREEG